MKLLRRFLFLVLGVVASALERPAVRVTRAWTVGELTAINPSGALPVEMAWRTPPRIPDSLGESESGCILTQLFVDRRGRFTLLSVQGGTETEKTEFRQALRKARLQVKFPAEASVGVKAWFATYFRATSSDGHNTAVTIRRITPVFHSGEAPAGTIRERRLKLLVNPSGSPTLVAGQKIDANMRPAIGEALANWRFEPPRINGVPGFGEIDVPLLFALNEQRTAFFTPAVLIQQTLPTRPRWMRVLGIGDQNRLRFKIGKDGTVREVTQLDPTWSSTYNEELVRLAKTWRFSPEVRNGVAVEATRVLGFGRPPAPLPPLDLPAQPGAAVTPPHTNKTIGIERRPESPSVQIRITIDKTGAVSQTLIERAADIAYATEVVARYRSSQWDPATANGAPVEYTFRLRP